MADLPDLTLPLPAPDLVARVNATEDRVAALESDSGTSGSVSLTPHPSWPWALIANVEGGVPDPDNHAPTVTINTAATVITGLDATLYWSGADVDGNPLTFSVDWGDGQTTNGATSPAIHTYATGGTFTATVTASDGQATGQATHDFLAVDPNAPSAYHQAVMADGPIMYWPLDELTPPAVEVVGSTATTSASWPVFGKPGIGDGDTCVDFFDNTAVPGDAVINAGPATATDGLTTFTMECLVEPASNSGSGYILDRDDSTSNRVFRFTRSNRKFSFSHRGGPTVTSALDYDAGFIYHLAVVADGANLTLYVNGAQAAQSATSAALPTRTVDLNIGGTGVAPGPKFLGKIAGAAIYDRALSPAEIQEHVTAANIPA